MRSIETGEAAPPRPRRFRQRLVLAAVAFLPSCAGRVPDARPQGFWFPGEGRVVDLTRPLAEGEDERSTTLAAGSADRALGTTLARIEPGRCLAPIVVIDVRERAARAPELVVTAEDVAEHEGRRGEVPPGAFVLLATGGGQRDARERDAPRLLHAGFSPAAAELLIRQRGAIGLGTDAPALDPTSMALPEAERAAFTLGACVLTNLARLDDLPDGRGILLLAPPALERPRAAVRVLALVSRTVGRGSR